MTRTMNEILIFLAGAVVSCSFLIAVLLLEWLHR